MHGYQLPLEMSHFCLETLDLDLELIIELIMITYSSLSTSILALKECQRHIDIDKDQRMVTQMRKMIVNLKETMMRTMKMGESESC